jgi:hypothetical protein
MTVNQAEALGPLQLGALQPLQLSAFSPQVMASLSVAQLQALAPSQFASLDPTQLAAISPHALSTLSSAVIATLDGEQVSGLSVAQVLSLNASQLAALADAAMPGLDANALHAMSLTQFGQLRPDQIAMLSAQQFGALTPIEVAALTPAHMAALEPWQISAMTASQLAMLGTEQVAALTPGGFGHLSAEQIPSLGAAEVGALKGNQINAMTTDALQAFTPQQVAAMTTSELAGIDMNHVAAFTAGQRSAMSADQLNALAGASPLVLDLSGLGVQTVDAAHGISFDINATGQAQHIGWVGAGSGLLVLDRNGNGRIDDGSELFGTATRLANGQLAENGFQALAQLDSNHDGKLTAADAEFSHLKVWVGSSAQSAGQLKSLADLGIVELDLSALHSTTLQQGNLVGLEAGYTTQDGARHELADVWFAQAGTQPLPLPALTELLQPATTPLLAGAPGPGGPPSARVRREATSGRQQRLVARGRTHVSCWTKRPKRGHASACRR